MVRLYKGSKWRIKGKIRTKVQWCRFKQSYSKKYIIQAYDKTLNKDNRFTMIQDLKGKSNFALFNHIVSGELLTHELKMI